MENMLRRDLFVLAVASFNPGPSYYDVCVTLGTCPAYQNRKGAGEFWST